MNSFLLIFFLPAEKDLFLVCAEFLPFFKPMKNNVKLLIKSEFRNIYQRTITYGQRKKMYNLI